MNSKIVYAEDQITREYIGTRVIYEDTFEPGHYNPISSTYEDEPPEPEEGKAIVRKADRTAWELVEDTRGIWYKPDRTAVEVEQLSDVIPPTWSRIQPAPLPQYTTQFDSLDFIDLFSESEQLAVVEATLQNAQIKLWYDKMLAANFVSLSDPRTIGGLDALVSAGLITAARKAEILTPQLVQS